MYKRYVHCMPRIVLRLRILFRRTTPTPIHSLHAERDIIIHVQQSTHCYFNPLAPCGARRLCARRRQARCSDFNPLAPYGARQQRPAPLEGGILFQSTRSVRSETAVVNACAKQDVFQSTRSVRSETRRRKPRLESRPISIHSLRAERDFSLSSLGEKFFHFNPLAPCGARHSGANTDEFLSIFQSTRPVRSETRARARQSDA